MDIADPLPSDTSLPHHCPHYRLIDIAEASQQTASLNTSQHRRPARSGLITTARVNHAGCCDLIAKIVIELCAHRCYNWIKHNRILWTAIYLLFRKMDAQAW